MRGLSLARAPWSTPAAEAEESALFYALERELEIATDNAEVRRYLHGAFGRLRVGEHRTVVPRDRAAIRTRPRRGIELNGRTIALPGDRTDSDFKLGFYGSSRLFVESFRNNPRWYAFYAAAVRIGDRGILIGGRSLAGKTTFVLALLDRGARLYGDEFAFVRRSDRVVSGCARTLHLREPSLPFIRNARLKAYCAAQPARIAADGWRAWDFVEPTAIYGPQICAAPAPLGALVLLDRDDGPARVERVPSSLAAFEFAQRLDSNFEGGDTLEELGRAFFRTPAYRVTLGSSDEAAAHLLDESERWS